MTAPPRDDRLQLRIDAATKRQLEDAAQVTHQSLSAFVLQAAKAEAIAVLADRDAITLSPEAAMALSEALTRPAHVNERLLHALRRPSSITWLD